MCGTALLSAARAEVEQTGNEEDEWWNLPALVRVRGWIVDRAGQPAIDLTAAGSVEVIAEADVSDPTGGRRAERRPRPK